MSLSGGVIVLVGASAVGTGVGGIALGGAGGGCYIGGVAVSGCGDGLGFSGGAGRAGALLRTACSAGGILGNSPAAVGMSLGRSVIILVGASAVGTGVGSIALGGAGRLGDGGLIIMLEAFRFHIEKVDLIAQSGGAAAGGGDTADFHGVDAAVRADGAAAGVEDNTVGNAVAVRIHRHVRSGGGYGTAGGTVEGPGSSVRLACEGNCDFGEIGSGVLSGVQGNGPGIVGAEEIGGMVSGCGPGNVVIVDIGTAAVEDLGDDVVPAGVCLGISEAHIQQRGVQKPSAVADSGQVVAAVICHAAGNGGLQTNQGRIAVPGGDVAGGGGVVAPLIEAVIHISRLGRVMGQFVVGGQNHGAVLRVFVQGIAELDSGKIRHKADIVQIRNAAFQKVVGQTAGGIGGADGRNFIVEGGCGGDFLPFFLNGGLAGTCGVQISAGIGREGKSGYAQQHCQYHHEQTFHFHEDSSRFSVYIHYMI